MVIGRRSIRPVADRRSQNVKRWEAQKKQMRDAYGQLFDDLSALLFRHDPMGINFEDNSDEYELEVGTILPRLRGAQGPDDVETIVRQEFSRWFGDSHVEASARGPVGISGRYPPLAREILQLWSGSVLSDVGEIESPPDVPLADAPLQPT